MYRTVVAIVFLQIVCALIQTHEDSHEEQIITHEDQLIVSYEKCKYDEDCRENSFCFGNDDTTYGYCKCKESFELLFRNKTFYQCSKSVNINEPCLTDFECASRKGICSASTGTCQCSNNNHLYTDGFCYDTVLLYDYCYSTGNCLLSSGSFAYCIDGICDCKPFERASSDRTSCIASKNLGDLCANDIECSLILNSRCGPLICECAVGYVMDRNEKFCLKAATMYKDTCIENSQCSNSFEGTKCIDSHCLCPINQHYFNGKCYQSVQLKGACNLNEECFINDKFNIDIIRCREGVCECVNNDCSNSSQKNILFTFLIMCATAILYL